MQEELLCEYVVKQKDTERHGSIAQWWKSHQEIEWKYPFAGDCALVAGSTFESLGYVFASCYQCAVKALVNVGDPDNKLKRCVCATEGKGPFHPRKVNTTIRYVEKEDKWLLNGHKSFVTLGHEADQYIVLAKIAPQESEKAEFKVVLVDSNQKGVSCTELPELPFLPEIGHAKVDFVDVKIESKAVLEGDGFEDYIKPFRTVEDCLVISGILGFVIQQIRTHRNWNKPELLEKALALSLTLRELCEMNPSSPITHMTLAGVYSGVRELIEGIESVWDVKEESYKNWNRDKKLIDIAQTARTKRLQKARSSL